MTAKAPLGRLRSECRVVRSPARGQHWHHPARAKLVNLAGLGVLFGAARIWTGSLSLGIGMHAAWNIGAANVFGSLDAGGVRDVSILALDTATHFPWTGGGYGIEGGAVVTVVIALAAVGLVAAPAIRGRQPYSALADYRPRCSDRGGGGRAVLNSGKRANISMQRTTLRAAADAGRWADEVLRDDRDDPHG
jgi:hypothetical protein